MHLSLSASLTDYMSGSKQSLVDEDTRNTYVYSPPQTLPVKDRGCQLLNTNSQRVVVCIKVCGTLEETHTDATWRAREALPKR
jgi:hypothetical protein